MFEIFFNINFNWFFIFISEVAKINSKVDLLAPVLDEKQLKQYRNHLKSNNKMMDMIIDSMETLEGDE